jgi:hypothetical protein
MAGRPATLLLLLLLLLLWRTKLPSKQASTWATPSANILASAPTTAPAAPCQEHAANI